MSTTATKPPKRLLRPGLTFGICAALLVAFAGLSYSAALQKSATYDEPLHVLGGHLKRHYHDYRLNPEDPALFSWIVSLPNPRSSLKVDFKPGEWSAIYDDIGYQWPFIWYTMYKSGNDEQRVLNASRAVCTTIGVVLGVLVAWWSYRLAGSIAAIAATTLYALCPNFLAHASIVKNDVPLACVMLGLMLAVWLLGRRGSLLRLASVALLCGAALGIKYSGVLAGPIVAIVLGARALLPQPWEFLRINLDTRLKRLAAAGATCVLCAVVAYAAVWAAYGFRFRPSPDSDRYFNMSYLQRLASFKELVARYERARLKMEARGQTPTPENLPPPTDNDLRTHRPARVVEAVLALNRHGILPQGWLAGFLYTYATTLVRSTYLNGEIQNVGRVQFFPLAMLYKTPAATLIAIVAAAAMAIAIGRLRPRPAPPDSSAAPRRLDAWSHVCLWVAPLLYGASALTTNLNLGLRHILPVYPFIFIGVGVVVAKVVARWRVPGVLASVMLALALFIESSLAYPNFIPFFNVFVGDGFKLLGDSNLDWGQDLKELAEWQKQNPGRKLYLHYFGVADPQYYGVKATYLPGGPGGYIFATTPPQNPVPGEPAVIAVSATDLQGIYFDPASRAAYQQMLLHQPLAVLGGGSIYLYEYPFTPRTLKDAPRQ